MSLEQKEYALQCPLSPLEKELAGFVGRTAATIKVAIEIGANKAGTLFTDPASPLFPLNPFTVTHGQAKDVFTHLMSKSLGEIMPPDVAKDFQDATGEDPKLWYLDANPELPLLVKIDGDPNYFPDPHREWGKFVMEPETILFLGITRNLPKQ